MRYILLIACVLVAGCNPCSDKTCFNGSKEQDGRDCKCVCEKWYSGDECSKPANQKFDGNYAGTLSCPNGQEESFLEINADNNIPNRLTIKSFEAHINLIDENGNFDIPKQDVPNNSDIETISGTGSFQNNSINVDLTFTDILGQQQECNFYGTK